MNSSFPFFQRVKPVPNNAGFRMDGYWIWCGSVIVGEDGRYYMFASRWSRDLPMFSGYILSSEIVRAVSDTPCGPYRFLEKVLPSGNPKAWDGRMAHNPTIHKCGDTYLLYYIGSTFTGPIQQDSQDACEAQCAESYSNIRIGLATSRSLDGPWKTLDKPVLEPRPDKWDSQIVTNPAPCVREDGRVVLFYRSNTPQGLRIGVAAADSYEGPYHRLSDDPILRFEGGDFVEDPFVWWEKDHYEMLAKDMLGGITGEIHAGAHFRSSDAIHWTPMEPPKAYSRTVAFENGVDTQLGCLERAQLLFDDNDLPICLFAAAADGPGGFHHAHNTWNIAIPLGS
ncbi:MAG: glycoside hydrolase family protein [Verrucomicrobiota bacterium]